MREIEGNYNFSLQIDRLYTKLSTQLKFILFIDKTENIGTSLKHETSKVKNVHPGSEFSQSEKVYGGITCVSC